MRLTPLSTSQLEQLEKDLIELHTPDLTPVSPTVKFSINYDDLLQRCRLLESQAKNWREMYQDQLRAKCRFLEAYSQSQKFLDEALQFARFFADIGAAKNGFDENEWELRKKGLQNLLDVTGESAKYKNHEN